MSRRLALASLLVACVPAALAALPSDPPKPAGILIQKSTEPHTDYFRAQVDIDSEGRVVKVQPEKATPQEMRSALSTAVQQLRFAPAMRDGQAMAGTTFVGMRGCPKGGVPGGELEFRYVSHGPGWLTRSTPWFPDKAALENVDGSIEVELRILPDGSAEYVSMDVTQGGAPAKRAYRDSVKVWAAQQRFAVEKVGGQAQPGTAVFPVAFAVGHIPKRPATPDPCDEERPADPAVRARSAFTLLGGT